MIVRLAFVAAVISRRRITLITKATKRRLSRLNPELCGLVFGKRKTRQ